MIGVQAITPGAEIDYTNPGMQVNADGSVQYFVTVANKGSAPVQFHFTGSSRGSWTWGINTALNAGQTQPVVAIVGRLSRTRNRRGATGYTWL